MCGDKVIRVDDIIINTTTKHTIDAININTETIFLEFVTV
jgi:hypothetical protein